MNLMRLKALVFLFAVSLSGAVFSSELNSFFKEYNANLNTVKDYADDMGADIVNVEHPSRFPIFQTKNFVSEIPQCSDKWRDIEEFIGNVPNGISLVTTYFMTLDGFVLNFAFKDEDKDIRTGSLFFPKKTEGNRCVAFERLEVETTKTCSAIKNGVLEKIPDVFYKKFNKPVKHYMLAYKSGTIFLFPSTLGCDMKISLQRTFR